MFLCPKIDERVEMITKIDDGKVKLYSVVRTLNYDKQLKTKWNSHKNEMD